MHKLSYIVRHPGNREGQDMEVGVNLIMGQFWGEIIYKCATMEKCVGIHSRISKVTQELEKLASIMKNQQEMYAKTREFLQDLQDQCESDDSLQTESALPHCSESRGFSNNNEVVSHESQQIQSIEYGSTIKSGLSVMADTSTHPKGVSANPTEQERAIETNQSRTADITVKRFRPMGSNSKKHVSSKKQKLSNSHSENKITNPNKLAYFHNKTYKKQEHGREAKAPNNRNARGMYKKVKKSYNLKSAMSQNRLNESLKMHIDLNLKKETSMKITDLKIQKILCTKEEEYLKSVMKLQQAGMETFTEYLKVPSHSEESAIIIFMVRLVVNFFNQFFNLRLVSDDCTCEQLLLVLAKPGYLLKYMIKLPDILRRDNTLCQQRCRRLFEEKHFIDHRVGGSLKVVHAVIIYGCVCSLYDYISSLINNNAVKETKRRILPVEFHSDRSPGNKKTHGGKNCAVNPTCKIKQPGENKQYDSERKNAKKAADSAQEGVHRAQVRPTLKRANTHKILSPKMELERCASRKQVKPVPHKTPCK